MFRQLSNYYANIERVFYYAIINRIFTKKECGILFFQINANMKITSIAKGFLTPQFRLTYEFEMT